MHAKRTFKEQCLEEKVFDLASNVPNYTAADYQYGSGYVLEKVAEIYLFKKLGNAFKTTTQSFQSFSAFKRAMGPAGQGRAWHHIVEQTPGNITRFGAEAIHNTNTLMNLPHGAGSIHARVSGYYSSIQPTVTGSSTLTVRQWLSVKSYQFQYDFGIQKLKDFGWKF